MMAEVLYDDDDDLGMSTIWGITQGVENPGRGLLRIRIGYRISLLSQHHRSICSG